jgi:uncharacterized membrane protein YfcA
MLRSVIVGVAAGILSGLFGVGGGVVIVPGLVFLLGMNQRVAHGTSLAAIVPIAAAALAGYAIESAVDYPAATLLVLGAVVGAYLGTRWLDQLPMRALQLGFVVLLIVAAVRLIIEIPPATGRIALDLAAAFGLVAVGLGAGALAGLMGVGGGIIMVPALVILFGIPDVVAKGTSLAVILPTAVVGTFRNVRNDNADLRVAAVVGVSGIVSAFVATRLAIRLDPQVSHVLFAVLLGVVAARLLFQARRA